MTKWNDSITAESLARAERDRLFAKFSAANPGFADYQTKTSRVIPVVALHRTNRAHEMHAWARTGQRCRLQARRLIKTWPRLVVSLVHGPVS